MKTDDLPRLPNDHLQRPKRQLQGLKPGERAVLITMLAIRVDEDCHVWVDGESAVTTGMPFTGMTLQVERTETGFILWLDKKTTFKPESFSLQKRWIPVVEFRAAEEEAE